MSSNLLFDIRALFSNNLALVSREIDKEFFDANIVTPLKGYLLMTSSQTGSNSTPVARPRRARLLVLDTVKYQRLFDALLGTEYELLVTDKPEEALLIASTKNPDLILLGHSDDVADGIEVARMIRATVAAPAPILLMLTADRPSLRREAEKAGCAGLLIKPVDRDRLKSRIEEHLR